jgi:hypothetical protein
VKSVCLNCNQDFEYSPHQSQRADFSAAEVPGSAEDLRVMELMAHVEKRFLVALGERFDALERRLDVRLQQLGERMEDLEDRDRYERHASRFLGAAPRLVEQYRTSDGDIFPSLSQ